MPKAPEYTPKQKRQLNKEWRQKTHEEGERQDFPNAPVWNDWLKEQRETKKRQVGFTRRLGRAAVEATAITVLVAKQTPRAISEYREQSNAHKTKRLQRVVNRANSADTIPDTDLRKVEKSRLRRIGRGAMSIFNRSNEKALHNTSQKVERLASKNQANRQTKMGNVENWASNKMGYIDSKRQQTHQRRQEQFKADKQVAWDKYLDENPEVEKRVIAENNQRDRQYEVDSQNKRYFEMQRDARYATNYFAEGNSYSFSKALPRRPGFEGSYDELAKSSVESAAKYRQEDGSITLFSPDTLFGIVEEKMPMSGDSAQRDGPIVHDDQGTHYTNWDFNNNDRQLFSEIRESDDYVGGVATSLWKMGFVEFDSERDISSGSGHRMNEAVEWSSSEDGTTTFASLAYNPDNELHRIVAGDQADPTNSRIQLAINNSQGYAPEMSVNLVEQPALVHAA